jgi:flagellar hook assembly protein FlgD
MQNFDCDGLDAIVNPIIVEPEQKPENPEDIKEPEANQEEVHGAACVGMDLAHVSHTTKGDKVTLTWTAVDGDTVDIAILNPEEGLYEKLATVKMADEKYVYTMKWNGEQNFMLTNNCGSVKYKADAAIEKTPEKIVTPATGPAENVLYIAIAAIILYGAYAIFFRKSDN